MGMKHRKRIKYKQRQKRKKKRLKLAAQGLDPKDYYCGRFYVGTKEA